MLGDPLALVWDAGGHSPRTCVAQLYWCDTVPVVRLQRFKVSHYHFTRRYVINGRIMCLLLRVLIRLLMLKHGLIY